MATRIPSSLNIISWNVASWTTTASYIAKHHGSVSNWLDRHNVDILCLQEVKATKQKLLASPACVLNPNHWDMFLSPCTAPRAGFNGVATLVRKNRFRSENVSGSFPTIGADPRPFKIPELDEQGRCILTDHGAFTLINVYVPFDGEKGVQVDLKLRFFDALTKLIADIRESGRSVVCVGDFNVATSPSDVHYEFRRVDVESLVGHDLERSVMVCEGKLRGAACNEVVGILTFLNENWGRMQDLLSVRRIVEIGSNNNGNKGVVKFALKIGAKGVQIGQRQASPGACETTANPSAVLTADGHVYKPAGILSVYDLFEVIAKLFGRDFSENSKMAFSDLFAIVPRSCPPVIDAFSKLTSGFVDSYLAVNPAGRKLGSERFTCWDQYRNERYENKGARIDYIFVDQKLAPAVKLIETERGDVEECPSLAVSSDRSKAAACVTAEGRWRPVPFIGGGIDAEPPSAAARDFEFLFTNPPQTGIVYTAPLFSDHVGTSCVIDLAKVDITGVNERMHDQLGKRWSETMADAIVEAPREERKSHSLKDMFAKAKRAVEEPVVVDLEVDEDTSADSIKRTRT